MPNLNLIRFYPFLPADVPELPRGSYGRECSEWLYGGEHCLGAREDTVLQVKRALRLRYIKNEPTTVQPQAEVIRK